MIKSLFRYPADRPRTAIVIGTTATSFAVYLLADSPWILLGYWALMLVPRGAMSAWNHHHQHCMTFRSGPANRLLEICYGLHTGMTTNVWVLHHVFGHHLNYLDQSKDESRWMRPDGTKMGTWEYIFSITVTAYPRAYAVGKRYPKHRTTFVVFGLLTLALVVTAVVYRPMPGLIVFALPMLTTLMWTSWATFDHHAGLPTDDPWEASYNIESRLYNFVSANLGYHTAHHLRPGTHWSRLPELHDKIKHQIPEHLRGTWAIVRPEPATASTPSAKPDSGVGLVTPAAVTPPQ
ncbi:MAG: fatty acid desaturase [Nannocystaceae bacterium]|nr:fatty acid desaturase [Nannocystaceae bacterium]